MAISYPVKILFYPDGSQEPAELTYLSIRPEPTPEGGPTALARVRVSIEASDKAHIFGVLRPGSVGRLEAVQRDSFTHDYGRLRVVYSQPSIPREGLIPWTIILEPVPSDPSPIAKDPGRCARVRHNAVEGEVPTE